MYKKKLKESKRYHSNLVDSLLESLREKTNETVRHGERIKAIAAEMGKIG